MAFKIKYIQAHRPGKRGYDVKIRQNKNNDLYIEKETDSSSGYLHYPGYCNDCAARSGSAYLAAAVSGKTGNVCCGSAFVMEKADIVYNITDDNIIVYNIQNKTVSVKYIGDYCA